MQKVKKAFRVVVMVRVRVRVRGKVHRSWMKNEKRVGLHGSHEMEMTRPGVSEAKTVQNVDARGTCITVAIEQLHNCT